MIEGAGHIHWNAHLRTMLKEEKLLANMLVTGGVGFIGGNFVRYCSKQNPDDTIIVLDCLTYARNRSTIADVEQTDLVVGDIGDTALVEKLLREQGVATLVHFVAESHIDRSITGPDAFIETNVIGTSSLLKAARMFRPWDAHARPTLATRRAAQVVWRAQCLFTVEMQAPCRTRHNAGDHAPKTSHSGV